MVMATGYCGTGYWILKELWCVANFKAGKTNFGRQVGGKEKKKKSDSNRNDSNFPIVSPLGGSSLPS